MRITLISDTHTRHKELAKDLPGGDLLLHAGDFSSMGYFEEVKNFCNWFELLRGYDYKICIAGNHELCFRDHPQQAKDLMNYYESEAMSYLQDELYGIPDFTEEAVKIYGSPWQPWFHNWAFNLPRNGDELREKWEEIPMDTDILVTHGPAWGHLDVVKGRTDNLGCELLAERIKIVQPKIHVFGHIHSGYGYKFDGTTHFFNASNLNEGYKYTQKPFTFDWDKETNEVTFL